jgi:hypothetical protein
VAKATLAPPAHGKFVRRVRSRAYFDPDQPRDEGGKWTETGGSVAAEKAGKKWAEDLTATEKDAVSHYASAGYANINAHLRGKKTTKTPSNDEIERLTKALDKASLPEAVTVYRGISKSLKLRPDMEFQDKGFMSTTTSFRNAVIFTGLQGPEGKGAVLELKVPKGYRAAHIAGKFGAIESENELLLQRGARFRTTKRHRVKVGLHVITVYEAEII